MEEAILVDLRDTIHGHPWWHARARLVEALLRRSGFSSGRVLDAGCGWGVTTLALEENGYETAGLDLSRGALEALDNGRRLLIQADLTEPLPADAPHFDAVLALDVIEHLDDDQAALRNLAKLARPGGLLIVSVPALPELFSEFDEVQGHRRRYTAETLKASFASAGLPSAKVLWWGAWMVPLLRRRKTKKDRPVEPFVDVYRRHLALPPWPLPFALRAAFRLDEFATLREWNRTGTSVVGVVQT